MTHCGFEPSAVADGFSSWTKFFELVKDFATIQGPRKTQGAYPRGKDLAYEETIAAADNAISGSESRHESAGRHS
jgi:hypothetical protein